MIVHEDNIRLGALIVASCPPDNKGSLWDGLLILYPFENNNEGWLVDGYVFDSSPDQYGVSGILT